MPGKWSVNVVCKCNTATGVDSMILILWMDLWFHPWSQAVTTCAFSDRGLVIFSWIGLNRVGFPKIFSCFSMFFFPWKPPFRRLALRNPIIGQAGSVASQICPQASLWDDTIWLWLTGPAMENPPIFKNGKPSLSIRAIYNMAMSNNQRVAFPTPIGPRKSDRSLISMSMLSGFYVLWRKTIFERRSPGIGCSGYSGWGEIQLSPVENGGYRW